MRWTAIPKSQGSVSGRSQVAAAVVVVVADADADADAPPPAVAAASAAPAVEHFAHCQCWAAGRL